MAGIRTDLAQEAYALHKPAKGVLAKESQLDDNLMLTEVQVMDQHGERAIGKPVGQYVTLDADALLQRDPLYLEKVVKALSVEITKLMGEINPKKSVMVIGLGNRAVTPDSLGPNVVDRVLVSRHVTEYLPDVVNDKVRPLCALAPGVLGVTGIETGEVVRGLVEHVQPALVIAVDALASRSTERICTTIQLTDTGIRPGSGLGSRRMELTRQSLGVPVLAIGVPTVVYASTISQDAVSLLLQEIGETGSEEALLALVERVMSERVGALVVTPKEIDQIIEDSAKIVADAINLAVHDVNVEELRRLLH